MKTIGALSLTALFLLLGIPTLAGAAQEKPEKQEEKAKPPKQEQQAKPQRQQEQKPAKQAPQPTRAQQTPQNKQPDKATKPAQQQARGAQDQQHAQAQKSQQSQQARKGQQDQKGQQAQAHQQQGGSFKAPQRTQEAQRRQHAQPALRLSVRGSARIPDDRFRSNFGSNHHFRIGSPVMVGGYSRFQYGGFWFGFAEPWPAQWYYTDDVYVDYVDGGYYMYNPYYPGERFAITVVI